MPIATIAANSIQPEPVRWFWGERVPYGAITIIEGDPSCNKSTLVYDLAARHTVGRGVPEDADGRSPQMEPEAVLLLAAEDSTRTVRVRLEAAGADLSRVQIYAPDAGGPDPTLPGGVGVLRETIRDHGTSLVVLDPASTFLSHGANSEGAVRAALTPLTRLAEETGAAIILVRHLRKGAASDPLYRGAGSIALTAAARSVLLVARHPIQPDLRVVAAVKSNLGPVAGSVAFALEGARDELSIAWRGRSEHSAAQLLSAGGPLERDELSRATEFLLVTLRPGPRRSLEVIALADDEDISKGTLRRAKRALGVVSQRHGFGPGSVVEWSLPARLRPVAATAGAVDAGGAVLRTATAQSRLAARTPGALARRRRRRVDVGLMAAENHPA